MLPNAPTAASGVRKVAMPASLSSTRASPTVASPIQHDSSGLYVVGNSAATARATASGSTPALGECMARMPSTSLSAAATRMAAA